MSPEKAQYTEEEKLQILKDFAAKMADQKPLEPWCAKIIHENFWELLS